LRRIAGRRLNVGFQRRFNRLKNRRERRIGHRLKRSLQSVSKGFRFLSIRKIDSLRGEHGGRRSGNPHHPLSHLPQRMVFSIEGFECGTPLVFPPLIEPAGDRPLQAVHLSLQNEVPGDLPLPAQPVLQAYFILNARWYRRPWVGTRATFWSRCRHSLQDVAGEVLDARVDCHPVVQFRIERNFIFQVSLEIGPVSAPVVRAIRWVVEG
jgi:hypothetical protein